jgi:DNA-binding helix-turn-helix protein
MKINVNAVKDTFNKYSLNELAEVLGIHRSTISYYRSGRDFTKNLNLKQLSILTTMSNIDNEETIEIDSDMVKLFHINFKNHSEFYRSRNLTGYQVTAKEYKLLVEASNLSIEDLTLPMYHEVIKAAKFYQFVLSLDQDKILENLVHLASLTGKTYGELAEDIINLKTTCRVL